MHDLNERATKTSDRGGICRGSCIKCSKTRSSCRGIHWYDPLRPESPPHIPSLAATATEPLMIAQIQVVQVPDMIIAKDRLMAASDELVQLADQVFPSMKQFGGGAKRFDDFVALFFFFFLHSNSTFCQYHMSRDRHCTRQATHRPLGRERP